MSFNSTQNLNPVYNNLTAEAIQTNDLVTATFTATTFDATTINATTIVSTLVDTQEVDAVTINATGVITGATVTATGTVNGVNVVASGVVTGTTVNGTTINGTTVDCTNCAPDNLTLNAPITTTNVTQPTINQLGYLVIVANSVDVPLTTTVESVAVVTPANIPVGVYQVNARVQLSIDAGVTIDSLQIQIQTSAGTISGEINNNPVTYAGASQYSTTQSVCYFNTVAQVVSIRVTATFAGGAVSIGTGNAKLSLVRIA